MRIRNRTIHSTVRSMTEKRTASHTRFFPIGDFHIKTLEQSKIFANYLNQRPESLIILLGDIIHFANSIWNIEVRERGREKGEPELIRGLEEDILIWESFIARLRVHTIYYLGTHETFAIPFIRKYLPSRKLKVTSQYAAIPNDFLIIKVDDSKSDPLYVTGLNVPGNIHPITSEKFAPMKMKVEKWIEDKTKDANIANPEATVFCTHDPCDVHYRNMGYRALTSILQKWPFKIHYHAHIHSNIHDLIVNKTNTVNRSFFALSKFKKEALEPSTVEIRSLYETEG